MNQLFKHFKHIGFSSTITFLFFLFMFDRKIHITIISSCVIDGIENTRAHETQFSQLFNL